ncbi:MAG: hypothetical protein H6618_07025 [Deltaproteobacteria bacterium]|nr:hypothetical protein [Deltaproteobacteria bacterium]
MNRVYISCICVPGILLLLFACTPQEKSSVNNQNEHQKNLSEQTSDPATDSQKTGQDEEDPFHSLNNQNDGIPTYDQANLDPYFNRQKPKTREVPDDYKEAPLLVKKSKYYRGIWLDLRKQVWKGFDEFTGKISGAAKSVLIDDNMSDYLLSVFRSPDKPKVKKISIWQPLQAPSLLSFAPDIPLNFYLAGHIAWPKLSHPEASTVVLSPNPFSDNADDSIIAPPEDYELIYRSAGEFTQDTLDMCEKIEINMFSGADVFPPIEDLTYCETILPGTLMGYRQEGAGRAGNYNPYTGTYNNAFDELFKKQSVAIWNPIPRKGYHCLGQVSTNGKMEKPYTERDFAQSQVDIGVGDRYAMYCVREEHTTEGILSFPPMMTDGEVTIFRVIAKNPDEGFDGANFFYAYKGLPDVKSLSEIKVWTLRKQSIRLLEDDSQNLKESPDPSK